MSDRDKTYTWLLDVETWNPHATADAGYAERCVEEAGLWLEEHAPHVSARAVQHGEATGIYLDRTDGTLQYLGCSVPVPGEIEEIIRRAMEHVAAKVRS